MVRQEDHDSVLGLSGIVKGLQHLAHAVVRAADRGVVQRQLLAHGGVVEQETRHGNFIRGEDPGRRERVLPTVSCLAVEGFVRVRYIDQQAERFVRLQTGLDAALRGRVIGLHVLDVQTLAVDFVQDQVPGIRRVGSRVRCLSANRREITGLLHQVAEDGIIGIAHLVKPLDAIVVRVPSAQHDVARRHAVADLHVSMCESQPFGGERVDIGSRARQPTTECADRIAAHVVNGEEQNIGAFRCRHRTIPCKHRQADEKQDGVEDAAHESSR